MQEIKHRDFPVVSRVYENLRMWNLFRACVSVCVHLCLSVKGDKREALCQCLFVPVFCVDIASVNASITYVCTVHLTVH